MITETHLIYDTSVPAADQGWFARTYEGNESIEEWTFNADQNSDIDTLLASSQADISKEVRVYRNSLSEHYEVAE